MIVNIAVAVIFFAIGAFWYRSVKKSAIRSAYEQARTELSELSLYKEVNFPPGTIQYRPILSGYETQAIDKIGLMHNENEFGILGYYENTIDPYPIFIRHKDLNPEPMVELGEAIKSYGEALLKKYNNQENA